MNILFLSELLHPHGTGGDLATFLWAKVLSKLGLDVRVVTNRFPMESERSDYCGLTIYRLPMFTTHDSVKYHVLRRFDVLLSNFMNRLFKWADVVYVPRYWYSAIAVAKSFNIPVITHIHAYSPPCSLGTLYDLSKMQVCDTRSHCRPRCIVSHELDHGRNLYATLASSMLNFALWPFIGKLVELSDAIICVSEAQRSLLATHMLCMMPKCHVVHNPLPNCQKLEITGKSLGYFGGPSLLKGFGTLCHALELVKSETTFHMTGFPHKSFMQLGRSEVTFHRRLPETEYEELYKEISAVVVPSLWAEPWGYVISEAILRGRLVIASNVGGIPEQTQGCPGVFLFEPKDLGGLADLVDHVNSLDRQTVVELETRNREILRRKFNDEKTVRSFMNVVDKVVSS